MNKVHVDPLVRAKLGNLDSQLEPCDESGKTLGYSLPTDPLHRGESRGGTVPILIALPLAVLYDVREADRLVEVPSVRHVPVPPRPGD